MAFTLHPAVGETLPLVLDSPHSGNTWPDDWRPVAPREALETGWDAYVAELFGSAPAHGAVLLEAHFPRTFIDLNRHRMDIDPDMLDGAWPSELLPTEKSVKGFGLLRRLALPGVPVYADRLPVAQVQAWLARYYDPYHAALTEALGRLHDQFGHAWHIDCHSMKSRGNAMNDDPGQARPDFVMSDLDGVTSDPHFTRFAAEALCGLGFKVGINAPYKGAELIRRHGDPAGGTHSIQVEVNRALYMDEPSRTRRPDFAAFQATMDAFLGRIAGFVRSSLG